MAKKNSSRKNGNRKPGLSRREMKKLLGMASSRQIQRRLQGTSVNPTCGSATEVAAKIIDGQQKRSVVVKVYIKDDSRRFKDRRKSFRVTEVDKLASRLVGASSRSVIEGLGIKLLDVHDKPELAHTVGKLVAARAVGMAKGIAASRCIVGGVVGGFARMGSGGLIDSIGSTGLEVEISPSGDVSAVVNPNSSTRPPSIGASTEEPPKKNKEEDVKVDHKVVVKHPNGTTTIHIDKLIVYIKVIQNDTMIVSNGTVNYDLAKHSPQILSAIDSKEPDEVKEEGDEDNENEG